MSYSDFVPTLSPQSWQQLGVNTIYAAAAGAFLARQLDIPGEYGALGVGGAYALVGFSNSPNMIVSSACHTLEGSLGGKDSVAEVLGNPCHGGAAGWLGKTGYQAAELEWEQIKAWWNTPSGGKTQGSTADKYIKDHPLKCDPKYNTKFLSCDWNHK